jgi:hypothetical protein
MSISHWGVFPTAQPQTPTPSPRLRELAGDYCRVDEALRKAMLRAERAEVTLGRWRKLMAPIQPKRVEVINSQGFREIHSLPI